jgi:hypothetical protein
MESTAKQKAAVQIDRGVAVRLSNERKCDLSANLNPSQARQYKVIPPRYQRSWLAAVSGEASPRRAIKAKCQECVGWEEVRSRVGTCNITACALWHHRPYQGAGDEEDSTP